MEYETCDLIFYISGCALFITLFLFVALQTISIIRKYSSVRHNVTLMALYTSINILLVTEILWYLCLFAGMNQILHLVSDVAFCVLLIAVFTLQVRTVKLIGKLGFYVCGKKILTYAYWTMLGLCICERIISRIYVSNKPYERIHLITDIAIFYCLLMITNLF